MNVVAKRSGIGLAATAVAFLAGCGGSGSTPAGMQQTSTGFFNLSVSDSPIRDAEKVCIKFDGVELKMANEASSCLLYTSPSPRDGLLSRMPSSA